LFYQDVVGMRRILGIEYDGSVTSIRAAARKRPR
jgi:hypothetical protein